jgi:hypothetical protein
MVGAGGEVPHMSKFGRVNRDLAETDETPINPAVVHIDALLTGPVKRGAQHGARHISARASRWVKPIRFHRSQECLFLDASSANRMSTPPSVLIKEPNERIINHAGFSEVFDVIEYVVVSCNDCWVDLLIFDSENHSRKEFLVVDESRQFPLHPMQLLIDRVGGDTELVSDLCGT